MARPIKQSFVECSRHFIIRRLVIFLNCHAVAIVKQPSDNVVHIAALWKTKNGKANTTPFTVGTMKAEQ